MRYFLERPYDYYLILSGDQLYRMDFRALLHQHIRLGADITLATKPVARHQVFEFGIMQSGVDRRITGFIEKPSDSIWCAGNEDEPGIAPRHRCE